MYTNSTRDTYLPEGDSEVFVVEFYVRPPHISKIDIFKNSSVEIIDTVVCNLSDGYVLRQIQTVVVGPIHSLRGSLPLSSSLAVYQSERS